MALDLSSLPEEKRKKIEKELENDPFVAQMLEYSQILREQEKEKEKERNGGFGNGEIWKNIKRGKVYKTSLQQSMDYVEKELEIKNRPDKKILLEQRKNYLNGEIERNREILQSISEKIPFPVYEEYGMFNVPGSREEVIEKIKKYLNFEPGEYRQPPFMEERKVRKWFRSKFFDGSLPEVDHAFENSLGYLVPFCPFPGEKEEKEWKKRFVLCNGYNRALNPNLDYREAKKPIFNWSKVKVPHASALRLFFDFGLWVGYAIPRGIMVLDIDHPEDVNTLRDQIKHLRMKEYNIFQTNNGYHLWFKITEEQDKEWKNSHYILKNGMKATVRKEGSYVIIASHWEGRTEKQGQPEDRFFPCVYDELTYRSSYFSSRFWECKGRNWTLPEEFTPITQYNIRENKTVNEEKEESNKTGEIFTALENQENQKNQETKTESIKPQLNEKIKPLYPSFAKKQQNYKGSSFLEKKIQEYFSKLNENAQKAVSLSQYPYGIDPATIPIKNKIKKFCAKKGIRHFTFLSSGNRAGYLKLSQEDVKDILLFSSHYTNNFKKTCITFLRGYVYAANKKNSLHEWKMKKRKKNRTWAEGEDLFKKEQIKKLLCYLKKQNTIPKFITLKELSEAGILDNGKGLGPSIRKYVNGTRIRVRIINKNAILKFKRKNIDPNPGKHYKFFDICYLFRTIKYRFASRKTNNIIFLSNKNYNKNKRIIFKNYFTNVYNTS